MAQFDIPLTKPYLDHDDLAAMRAAVEMKWIDQGEATTCLEEDFARYFGADGAVATNSGSSALILALRTLGITGGEEVILPSYTCLAVYNAVLQAGGVPVLVDNGYDVRAMDYNLTADQIRARINGRTAALIVPHMFGVPREIEQIVGLGIPVIEDVTLAVGAASEGCLGGSFGVLAVCSLHASKMISCGEGGILLAFDRGLYERSRYLNGWEQEQVSQRFADEIFFNYELRYNFHLNGISSALGASQLRKLPAFIARRRELGALYTETLSGIPGVICPEVDEKHVFFRYLVAVPEGTPVRVLNRYQDTGIEAGRGVYPPLHRFFKESVGSFVGAESAVNTLVSIPLYPALTEEEVEYILSVSVKVLQGLD